MRKNYKSNQTGRTMLEVILVLGFILLIGSAILAGISRVFAEIASTKASTQLVNLANDIYDRYALEGNYAGINSQKLIDDKVVPANMIQGTEIVNAKSEIITVSGVSGFEEVFFVSVPNINKKDCVEYLTIEWFSENGANLVTIEIDSNVFGWPFDPSYSSAYNPLPITTEKAMSLCKDTGNVIIWEFN